MPNPEFSMPARHDSLIADGAIAARERGTFVANIAVDYVLGRRTRFSENLALQLVIEPGA